MRDTVSVLYVEDRKGLREAVTAYARVEEFNVDIQTASNGEKGLNRQESESFDCIILDHEMPGVSGKEVFRELQKKSNSPPVIFFTASVDDISKIEDEYENPPTEIVKKGGGNQIERLLNTAVEAATN